MEIRNCYTCDNPRLLKDRKPPTKQVHKPKLNILLYKFQSGLWIMTKKELAVLKENFNNLIK